MLEKGFAWTLLGDLRRMLEDRFEVTVLLHQLGGSLVADSSHARDIIRGVPNESEVVRHELRSNAKPLFSVLKTYPVLFDIR